MAIYPGMAGMTGMAQGVRPVVKRAAKSNPATNQPANPADNGFLGSQVIKQGQFGYTPGGQIGVVPGEFINVVPWQSPKQPTPQEEQAKLTAEITNQQDILSHPAYQPGGQFADDAVRINQDIASRQNRLSQLGQSSPLGPSQTQLNNIQTADSTNPDTPPPPSAQADQEWQAYLANKDRLNQEILNLQSVKQSYQNTANGQTGPDTFWGKRIATVDAQILQRQGVLEKPFANTNTTLPPGLFGGQPDQPNQPTAGSPRMAGMPNTPAQRPNPAQPGVALTPGAAARGQPYIKPAQSMPQNYTTTAEENNFTGAVITDPNAPINPQTGQYDPGAAMLIAKSGQAGQGALNAQANLRTYYAEQAAKARMAMASAKGEGIVAEAQATLDLAPDMIQSWPKPFQDEAQKMLDAVKRNPGLRVQAAKEILKIQTRAGMAMERQSGAQEVAQGQTNQAIQSGRAAQRSILGGFAQTQDILTKLGQGDWLGAMSLAREAAAKIPDASQRYEALRQVYEHIIGLQNNADPAEEKKAIAKILSDSLNPALRQQESAVNRLSQADQDRYRKADSDRIEATANRESAKNAVTRQDANITELNKVNKHDRDTIGNNSWEAKMSRAETAKEKAMQEQDHWDSKVQSHQNTMDKLEGRTPGVKPTTPPPPGSGFTVTIPPQPPPPATQPAATPATQPAATPATQPAATPATQPAATPATPTPVTSQPSNVVPVTRSSALAIPATPAPQPHTATGYPQGTAQLDAKPDGTIMMDATKRAFIKTHSKWVPQTWDVNTKKYIPWLWNGTQYVNPQAATK